jgi:hypothetical protein
VTFKGLTIVISLILLSAPGPLGAAPEVSQPSPPQTTGPIITDTAVPIATGGVAIQPYLSLSILGGNFSSSWRRVSARGDFASLESPVKLTYGPVKNMEVYLYAPYIQNWGSGIRTPGQPGASSAQFGGVGDLLVVTKYQLLEETEARPTVTGFFGVTFPTGHHSHLNPGNQGLDALGAGAYSFTPGLNLSKWLKPFYLYANVWYSLATHAPPQAAHQLTGPLLQPPHRRNLLTVNLAAEWVWTTRWVALLECYSTWELGPPYSNQSGPGSANLGIAPGLEFILSPRWAFAVGLAIDLAGKNGAYQFTPMVTAIFTY